MYMFAISAILEIVFSATSSKSRVHSCICTSGMSFHILVHVHAHPPSSMMMACIHMYITIKFHNLFSTLKFHSRFCFKCRHVVPVLSVAIWVTSLYLL